MRLVRLAARGPALRWRPPDHLVVLETTPLGFAGAAEDDRRRWINCFRGLVDSLDRPLQVVVRVHPGPDADGVGHSTMPGSPDTRGADLAFAEDIRRSRSAHVFRTLLAVEAAQAGRLEAHLTELGVDFHKAESPPPLYAREEPHVLLHAGGFSRTWYAHRLPGSELEPGWWHRLLPPALRLSLAWHVTPLPVAWIVGYLQRQLVSMRATRLIESASGTADPLLAGAMPNAEDLQRRLASSQERAFHLSLYLTLTAPTRVDLEEGSASVQSAARALLCDLQPCAFRMLDGHLATTPSGPDRLQRTRVVDTSSLVTLFPWHEAAIDQKDGLVVGRHGVTGIPVMVDPFDHRRFANANMAVFGHSGAGKTYLMSTLAMGALGLGTQVFIVDPEHEYGALAAQLGGADVRLALGSGHALNVMDLRPGGRGDDEWLGPAVEDALDLCACICGGLDESERARLERAVHAVYQEVAQPVLRDVAERFARDSRLALVLGRWVEGSLGRMFSAPTNVDLDAPVVAFGMRELRDEMVTPVHFLLAEALWARIKRRDRRRMLVIDELGLLFEDPTIRRFVVSLARRIRKYDGSLVFASGAIRRKLNLSHFRSNVRSARMCRKLRARQQARTSALRADPNMRGGSVSRGREVEPRR